MRSVLFFLCVFSISAAAQKPITRLAEQLQIAPDSAKVKYYVAISKSYADNQPDSAVYFANLGMRFSEKRNDRKGQAELLMTLGYINGLHHHNELAKSFYNEALSVYKQLQDASGIAHVYDELGLLEGNKDDFNRALKYYQNSRDSSGQIETYEGIGKTLEEKGDIDKALYYYLRALAQYERLSQRSDEYYALLENIGHLYQRKGEPQIALKYLQKGIRNSQLESSRDTEVHLLNEEGKVYEQDQDPVKALGIYKLALAEAKKYKEPDEQAEALIQIAGILKKQDAKASIRDLQTALDISQRLKEPKLEARIYEALAGVYRQEKNYKEAMTALEEQHHLLDSVLNADTVKDIAALDSSYMLERSREKVDQLEKSNNDEKAAFELATMLAVAVVIILILVWIYLRKVKRLNKELENSNKVKDTLFSVIGHDLKGPAGSAAQLFEIMETEEFSESEMRGMIAELRKQTKASLDLLQSLFEWGKSQLRGIQVNVVIFDPEPVIERTINLLSPQAAQKAIHLHAEVPPGLKLYADADHFEFVIRNLLSNAIKFSYEGGHIEIKGLAKQGKHEMIFSVKDTGIGMDKAQRENFLTGNLQINYGTNQEKGSGLGLLLTKDFVKANNGSIWIESEEAKGTTFFVSLPIR